MEERKRKMDVNRLSLEQATELSKQIGKKVEDIRLKAQADINRVLNIYQMQGVLEIKVGRLESQE